MDSARCVMCLHCFTRRSQWLAVPPGPAIAILANTLAEARTIVPKLALNITKGNLKDHTYYGGSGKNFYSCEEYDVLLLRI
jgi:hypothetical protein